MVPLHLRSATGPEHLRAAPRAGSMTCRSAARFWTFLPFFANKDTTDSLLDDARLKSTLSDRRARRSSTDAIDDWRHESVRAAPDRALRHGAYQKTVVMKYLDNLIAWGDQLFRQDTHRESINEATQLYVLAAEHPRASGRSRSRRRAARSRVSYRRARGAAARRVLQRAGRGREPDRPNEAHSDGTPEPATSGTAAITSVAASLLSSASRTTRSCSATGTRSPTGCSRSATA